MSLSDTTHMTGQRRVHLPMYPISILSQEGLSDFVVIHLLNTLCEFIFGSNKISSLSHHIVLTFPCLAMNCLNSIMNESVSILFVISIWIPRLAKHMKRAPYHFKIVLLSLISNGPNISTPQ